MENIKLGTIDKIKLRTYWEGNHPNQEDYNFFHNLLVPKEGHCSTREGEMLRAVSFIYYDYYNNGWINNWSGPLEYLKRFFSNLDSQTYQYLSRYRYGDNYEADMDDDKIQEMLNDLITSVIVYINSGLKSNDMYSLTEEG